MLRPRLPLLSALLVLLLPAGRCAAAAPLRASGFRCEGRGDAPGTSREPPAVTMHGMKSPGRGSRSHHGMEGNHKNLTHKDKFILHLTGPLCFHPTCRESFNRLYHRTRDCTVPAYYKRCARLLTRLANSTCISKRETRADTVRLPRRRAASRGRLVQHSHSQRPDRDAARLAAS